MAVSYRFNVFTATIRSPNDSAGKPPAPESPPPRTPTAAAPGDTTPSFLFSHWLLTPSKNLAAVQEPHPPACHNTIEEIANSPRSPSGSRAEARP
jgi:hypothetical protein